MARPTNEGQPATEPEQTSRRESYLAGEPESAPELVRLMNYTSIEDITAILITIVLRAAL